MTAREVIPKVGRLNAPCISNASGKEKERNEAEMPSIGKSREKLPKTQQIGEDCSRYKQGKVASNTMLRQKVNILQDEELRKQWTENCSSHQ